MKSNAEMRALAWQAVRGGELSRYLMVWIALVLVIGGINQVLNGLMAGLGVETWATFLQDVARSMQTHREIVMPTRETAVRLSEATVFVIFAGCVLHGIMTYGTAAFFLRAAKGKRERWFAGAFDGFRRPLGIAWLFFLYSFFVILWSCLFVVPGFIAVYRYCQCWNVKIEHPDRSAAQCLAESCRIMKGRKMRRFAFDCSYWKPITLLMLGVLAMTVVGCFEIAGGWVTVALFSVLSIACLYGAVVLTVYMSVGQAHFYLGAAREATKPVE